MVCQMRKVFQNQLIFTPLFSKLRTLFIPREKVNQDGIISIKTLLIILSDPHPHRLYISQSSYISIHIGILHPSGPTLWSCNPWGRETAQQLRVFIAFPIDIRSVLSTHRRQLLSTYNSISRGLQSSLLVSVDNCSIHPHGHIHIHKNRCSKGKRDCST